MHGRSRMLARASSSLAAVALSVLVAGPAMAHEQRDVGEYSFVVGFIAEPVFVGQKSGLEFSVSLGDEPVEGLEATLQAEAIYQGQRRELELSPRFGEPGWYQSVFFPTAAGAYTFHISGTIEGTPIDEEFTSSADGFSEVEELGGGQFPVQFPAHAELVADAEAGSGAASQITLALGLGAAGLVVGLIALGIAVASRRRSA